MFDLDELDRADQALNRMNEDVEHASEEDATE